MPELAAERRAFYELAAARFATSLIRAPVPDPTAIERTMRASAVPIVPAPGMDEALTSTTSMAESSPTQRGRTGKSP
jgi:hypothetical protein